MIDTERDAREGIEAMVLGDHIPRSAWGGDESACVLAYALNMRVLNYDETTGQKWEHNREAEANGTVRLMRLDWGYYRALRPCL